MDYTQSQHILQRLKLAGVWSKKSLGQHFLIDKEVLAVIIETAHLQSSETVVEVGPGMGVLSSELLTRVARVVAFEYDTDMVGILGKDLPNLEVVPGDVLRTAPELLKELGKYKVVANIPYQITTPLLRMFLETSFPPTSLTLLVQKEVGQRLAAGPKQQGRGYLSVMCEYFSAISYCQTVPNSSFWPAPEVDSAIIHLELYQVRRFSRQEEVEFLKFVRMLFVHPRKQLKNVLAGIRGVTSAEVVAYFKTLELPDTKRAQELSLDSWISLYLHPFK